MVEFVFGIHLHRRVSLRFSSGVTQGCSELFYRKTFILNMLRCSYFGVFLVGITVAKTVTVGTIEQAMNNR